MFLISSVALKLYATLFLDLRYCDTTVKRSVLGLVTKGKIELNEGESLLHYFNIKPVLNIRSLLVIKYKKTNNLTA